VHPNVKKLLELQRVDQELASLRRDTDALPAEEAKRKKKLDELERLAAEKKERSTKCELDSRALDKAIRQGDDEVKKLTERLNTVRNNAEYQATLFQIEAVKKDRDQTQEECLKLLEALDGYKKEVEATAKVAAEERAVFQQFLAEAEKLRNARKGDIDAVTQKRNAVAQGVQADILNDYQRMLGTRNGMSVCAVDGGGYCQGCYSKITTNDRAKLMGSSAIVQCGSCQRILYLATDVGASGSGVK
jgi:predicted  nucleic acid-binding Zn-ribbon protein